MSVLSMMRVSGNADELAGAIRGILPRSLNASPPSTAA